MNQPIQSREQRSFAMAGLFVAALLGAVGCTNRREDCTWLATCVSSAGGADDPGNVGGAAGAAMVSLGGAVGSTGAALGGVAGTTGKAIGTAAGAASEPCNGQCKGDTPFCREETEDCVACLSNSDCPAEQAVCDRSGTCVECATHGDCSSNKPVCNNETSTCVECATNGDCSGSKPVCNNATATCIECLADGDCGSTKPVCNSATATCVECRSDSDCRDAAKSVCSQANFTCGPCTTDTDCRHISGSNVCLTGAAGDPNRCVQCSSKNPSACVNASGVALICNSLEHSCTNLPQQSAGACQPCVSDAQCKSGMLCREQLYEGKLVGHFCFYKQGDSTNGGTTCSRPYVKLETQATSIDGAVADLCTLRVSTCPALLMFADSEFQCAPNGIPDNQLCGFAAGKDSKCVSTGVSLNPFVCSVNCASSDDCPKVGNVTCDKGTYLCSVP